MIVTRHTVATRHGIVHLRRAGRPGTPVLVALHATPRSSLDLLPIARALADRFTVLLVDTPGYGWSDGLPFARPTAADLADAIDAALAAHGVERAVVYGLHTGASIAIEMACRHADRVSALVLDAVPALNAAERDAWVAGAMPAFPLSADGAHLTWAWGRIRDGVTFMPFALAGTSVRVNRALPPPEAIHAGVLDLLRAGPHYLDGYHAAFRHRTAERLGHVPVPMRALCRADDVLRPYGDRLPASLDVAVVAPDPGVWTAAIAERALAVAEGTNARPAAADDVGRGFVSTPAGQLHVRRSRGEGRPIVLLHDPTRGGRAFAPMLARAEGRRPIVAIDLPGTGGSREAGIDAPPETLAAAIRALGLADAVIVGQGASATLAGALTRHVPGAHPVALDGTDEPEPILDLAPRLDGGHLLAAWWRERDRRAWSPWWRRTPDHALSHPSGHDLDALQAGTLDALEAVDGPRAEPGPMPAQRLDVGPVDPGVLADALCGLAPIAGS